MADRGPRVGKGCSPNGNPNFPTTNCSSSVDVGWRRRGSLKVAPLEPSVSVDTTAIGGMVAPILPGVWAGVSPEKRLSGCSNPEMLTVLAMFVLSEGVRRTGVVRRLGRLMQRFTGRSERRHLVATLGISGPLAGIINNTPVVAVLIPTIVDLAKTNRLSPSKLLIPLSYASMLGGMLTLIGTASTILASDLSARLLDHPIGMFEFTPLGLIVLVVGTGYLLTVAPRLIPERIHPAEDLTATFRMRAYLQRVRVREDSPLVGETIEAGMAVMPIDMDILQIIRNGSTYVGPFTDQTIAAQDILTIRADESTRERFADRMHLELMPAQTVTDDAFIDRNHTLLECTVPPDSPLEQETVISSTFRTRYHGTVLAIRRGDTVPLLGRDVADGKPCLAGQFGGSIGHALLHSKTLRYY